MSFKDLNIKKEYRIPRDNIVKELYIPLLKECSLYKRSVGFFTSSSLMEIANGLSYLINNNGKMLLIVSPNLEKEDIEAINKGYEIRNDLIERVILQYITEPQNYFEEEKLNLLANLIAQEKLDIKIAFSYKNNYLGLYHEKMGIFCDEENNKVAFSGSMNESQIAFNMNYEAIDVFTSWYSEESSERLKNKEIAFDMLWNNQDESAKVMEFPEAAKKKLLKYKKDKINYKILAENDGDELVGEKHYQRPILTNCPTIPEGVKLYPYQIEAIENWKSNNYRGIFDMATGTGKTYTGLGAITKIYNELNGKLAVIIVCPYQHLVNQWVEDICKFNICPIIGHSSSEQKDFKKRLKDSIIDYNLDIRKFFCFVCTNSTYSTKYIQEELNKIKGDVLLVVDEAHNFGSETLKQTLDERFNYRLALSATLDRHRDEEGTRKLYNYFEKKCIEFSLEQAIEGKFLTPYKYYPIIVELTDEELLEYNELTREISRCIRLDKNGKKDFNQRGKELLIKRSRLVAGAENKAEVLRYIIQEYKNDKHILVYCGATKGFETDDDPQEKRQIDIITNILGNELKMNVSQFTSQEDNNEREILRKKFGEGDVLQALIAIKCLDEGVNIPEIKIAFILASTTNPKEYIQRRGRVLRKAKGKDYAIIFDFVTLPRKLENVKCLPKEETRRDKALVKNELNRIIEFKRLAMNSTDSDELIDEINEAYDLFEDCEEEL